MSIASMILRWCFDVLIENSISHLLICAIICQRPTPTSYPIRPPNPLEYFVDEGGTKYQGEKSLASSFVWKLFNWLTFTSLIFASHLVAPSHAPPQNYPSRPIDPLE
jgi:hypothetical protein